MATEVPAVERRDPVARWVTAGVVTGLLLEIIQLPLAEATDLQSLGATIGVPTVVGGIIQALLVSVVALVIFAAIVSGTSLRKYTYRLRTLVPLGVAYAVVLWVVYASVALPFWQRAVGLDVAFPAFEPVVLVVHVVIGVLIGVVYYYALRVLRRRERVEPEPASPGQAV